MKNNIKLILSSAFVAITFSASQASQGNPLNLTDKSVQHLRKMQDNHKISNEQEWLGISESQGTSKEVAIQQYKEDVKTRKEIEQGYLGLLKAKEYVTTELHKTQAQISKNTSTAVEWADIIQTPDQTPDTELLAQYNHQVKQQSKLKNEEFGLMIFELAMEISATIGPDIIEGVRQNQQKRARQNNRR